MRRIRIGNDIRLKLEVVAPGVKKCLYDESDVIEMIAPSERVPDFTLSNVKQIRCYLINTSFNKNIEEEEKKKLKRIGFPDFYRPTAYNINNTGFPHYHIEPANACNYDRFLPDFHDFHWWPGYRGFGIHPEHFHNHTEVFNIHKPNDKHKVEPWYLADSWVLEGANNIACMFPAEDQLMCGTYKLVVVITVYQKGWGRHDLRTYTIDKGDIFELVDNESGASGPITIDVDDTGSNDGIVPTVMNVYKNIMPTECYTLLPGMDLEIGGQDIDGREYYLYTKLSDGTTALYNPYDWRNGELRFKTDSSDITVDANTGKIHAVCTTDNACIVVTDLEGVQRGSFCVTVDHTMPIYIGFDTRSSFVDITMDNMRRRSGAQDIIEVNNNECGGYLWIFSQRKLLYVKTDDGVVSSSIRVPMIPGNKKKDGYFCYRSVAPIVKGDMKIKLIYA